MNNEYVPYMTDINDSLLAIYDNLLAINDSFIIPPSSNVGLYMMVDINLFLNFKFLTK